MVVICHSLVDDLVPVGLNLVFGDILEFFTVEKERKRVSLTESLVVDRPKKRPRGKRGLGAREKKREIATHADMNELYLLFPKCRQR